MKKLAILSIAFVAVSFASCKKDYTCVCKETHSFSSMSGYYNNNIYIINDTESSAKTECEAKKNSADLTTSTTTISTVCSIQ